MKNILGFINKHKNKIVVGVSVISGVLGVATVKSAIKAVKVAEDVKAKLEQDVKTCVEMGETVGYTEQDKINDINIINVQHTVACIRAWVLPIASFVVCGLSTFKIYELSKRGDIAVPESLLSYCNVLKIRKL